MKSLHHREMRSLHRKMNFLHRKIESLQHHKWTAPKDIRFGLARFSQKDPSLPMDLTNTFKSLVRNYLKLKKLSLRKAHTGSRNTFELKKLSLKKAYIGSENTIALADHFLPYISGLQHLDLSFNNMGYEGLAHLADILTNFEGLQHLDLSGNQIGAPTFATRGMKTPFDVLALYVASSDISFLSRVKVLKLAEVVAIGKHLFSFIQSLSHLKELEHLDLSRNHLTEAVINALSTALSQLGKKQLTLLLDGNDLGPTGAQALNLKGLATLAVLSLNANKLGNKGLEALAPNLNLNSLRQLSLDFNEIGDEGAITLATLLSRLPIDQKLEKLDLTGNHFSTKGIAMLAAAFAKAQSLEEVNLGSNTLFNTESVKALFEGLSNTNITRLSLSGNINIGEEGLNLLIDALGKPGTKLTTLDLSGIELSDENIERLSNVMQNNKILVKLIIDNPQSLKHKEVLKGNECPKNNQNMPQNSVQPPRQKMKPIFRTFFPVGNNEDTRVKEGTSRVLTRRQFKK